VVFSNGTLFSKHLVQ